MGALGFHESPSTYLIFSQCVHASDFRPQLAVGVTDGICCDKIFVKNETRRHGGMYFTVKFRNLHLTLLQKKPFLWYTNLSNGL